MSRIRPWISWRFGSGVIGVSIALIVGGCTAHPAGEREERDLAAQEGQAYLERPEDRKVPPLPPQPSPDDLVQFAMLASPELEQRYWEWRAAIEQVPQDGTQPTNLVLFAGVPITSGSTAFDRTTVTASNDPMGDIQWPSKPATAARRALEAARAAGLRFQDAKFGLRQKVMSAYYEYALAAELVRLESDNLRVLTATAEVAEQGIASGRSTQAATLAARNEAAMSQNQLEGLRARLPGLAASLNVAIGRAETEPIVPPSSLPEPREVGRSVEELLILIEQKNPELAGLDAELRGKAEGLRLAKLQYMPDFSLSGGTDLGGITQNLSGMVTVPLLRHEAIRAAIAQAEANFRATEAMRRQTGNELRGRLVADIATADDLLRQLGLVKDSLVPRAASVLAVTRSQYESGRSTFGDLMQAERSVIDLKRLEANVKVAYAQRLTYIERIVGHHQATERKT